MKLAREYRKLGASDIRIYIDLIEEARAECARHVRDE